MPSWKKVITSGSNAILAQISASVVPTATTQNLLAIDSSTGGIMQIAQSNVSSSTTAEDTFKATGVRTGDGFISGDVGIGTTTPTKKLEVRGNALFSGSRNVHINAVGGGNIRITPPSGGWEEGYFFNYLNEATHKGGFGGYGSGDTLNYFWIGENYNDNTMVITSESKRVGINLGSTTSPVKTLEISTDSATTDLNDSLSGAGTGSGVLIRNINTTTNTYANLDFRANNADGRIAYQYKGADNKGDFHFITDNASLTSRLTIKGDGGVGIGTTSPSYMLDVSGSARLGGNESTTTLRIQSTGSFSQPAVASEIQMLGYESRGQGIFFKDIDNPNKEWFAGVPYQNNDLTHYQIGYSSNADGRAEYLNSSSLTIRSTGKVGIGTADPKSRLHIAAPAGEATSLIIEGDVGNSKNILFRSSSNGSEAKIREHAGTLGFFTGGDMNDANVFITSESGNVGIGTTSPGEKLTVEGNISASGEVNINAADALFSSALTVNGDAYTTAGWKLGSSATFVGKAYNSGGKYSIETDTDRDIQFGDVGTPAVMYIDTSTEKVGIGTTSPSEALDVTGNISVSDSGTFGGDLMPAVDSTHNIGSSAVRWASIYADGIAVSTITPVNIRLQGDIDILNKTQTAYIPFATRDTTGDETVMNLSNIGTLTTSGSVIISGSLSASGDLEVRNITASNIQVANDIALGGNIFSFSGFSFIEGVSANFSGSNKFGSGSSPGANDIAGGGIAHQFTGSVAITGSSLTTSNNLNVGNNLSVGSDLNITGDQLTFTNDAASAYIRGADALFIESDFDNDDASSKPIHFLTNGSEMVKFEATSASFAGNIILTGGGIIEAPSVSGGEDLTLKAAGGIDVIIDTNSNSPDAEAFRVMKHTNTELLSIKEDEQHVLKGNLYFGDSHFLGDDADDNLILSSSAGENIIIGSADGDLYFRTGSGTAMIIKSDGKVGIGTTAPTYKLDVESADEILASFVSTDNKAAIQIKDNDTTGYVSAENSRISIGPSPGVHTNNINIKTDTYNVGIGTISPQYLLSLSSSGHSMVEVQTSADNKKAGIRFDTLRTGAGMGGSELYKSGSHQYWFLDEGMFWNSNERQTMAAENSGIKFYSSSANNVSSTEFARFDILTKRLGIGTTSPGAKLHVVETGTGEALRIDGAGSGFALIVSGGSSYKTSLRNASIGNTYASSAAPANGLIVEGNVGIGTTSPGEKLEVVGNISASGDLTGDEVNINQYINHIGDADTYFGFSANNQVLFHVGGGDRLFINSTGNVGIGTTSPTSKLHLYTSGSQATGSSAALFIESRNHDASLRFGHNLTDAGHEIKYKGTDDGNDNDLEFLSDNIHVGGTYPTTKWMNVKQDGQVALGSGSLDDGAGVIFLPGSGSAYAGNVGIGTTSPNRKLEVSFAGNVHGARFTRNDAAGNSLIEFANTDGVKSTTGYDAGVDGYKIGTGSITNLLVKSSGNVGIGTTAPRAKLSISNNGGHTTGDVAIANSSFDLYNPLEANTDEKGSILTFSDNYSASGYHATTRAAIKGGTDTTGNTADGFLSFYTDKGSANSMPERMRIDHDGKVGIGTASPTELIEVRGETDVTPGVISLASSRNDASNVPVGVILGKNSSSTIAAISMSRGGGTHNGFMTFHTKETLTSGGPVERMRITENGSVGIGTTSPGEKLEVIGNISASGAVTGSTAKFGSLNLTSAAGAGHLLNLHNTTNGGGASINFSDITAGNQTGHIDFKHSNAASQGGGATFIISSSETDMVLNVGGRILATAHSNNAEVDYGFVDDVNTGMMRPSADFLRFVVGGDAVADMSSGQFTVTGELEATTLNITGNISASGDLEARNITASNIQVANDIALGGNIFSFSGFSFIEGVSANFSGSNVFGSGSSPGANDIAGGGTAHQFTGSVAITGSSLTLSNNLNVGDDITITSGSFRVETFGEGLQWYNGTDYDTNKIRLSDAQNLQVAVGGVIQLYDQTQLLSSSPIKFNNVDNTDSIFVHNGGGSGGGNSRLDFEDSSNSVKMSISSSGNVGIGTDSPAAPLHVRTTNTDTDNNLGAVSNPRAGILIHNLSEGANTYAALDFRAGYHDARIAVTNGGSNNGSMNFIVDNDNSPIVGMSISSSGNVGIGTTDPYHTLHVTGSARVQGQLMVGDSNADNSPAAPLHIKNSGTATLRIEDKDGDNSIYDITVNSGSGFSILEDANTRLFIEEGGNVGIGTTSPSTKFHVYNGEATIASSTDGVKLSYSSGNSSGIIDTAFADNNLEFRTNGSTRMFITGSTGNVGIGTLSPTTKLHIDNGGGGTLDSAYALGINGNGIDGIQIIAANNQESRVVFGDPDDDNVGWIAYDHTDDSMDFRVNATEKMVIQSDGKVGIGTTTPSARLDVVGDIRVLSASLSYQENTDVDNGTETIATLATGSYDAGFFDYVAKNGTNLRAGIVTAIHSASIVQYNEVSTVDIGDTSDVKLSVVETGGNLALRATTTTNNWNIKSLVRGL